jgi:hypothetical protein
LNKQLTQTKSHLVPIRQTVEDVEDAWATEREESAHGKKPHIPWSQVRTPLRLTEAYLLGAIYGLINILVTHS